MEVTYISQRHAINASPPPSMVDLKEQWPFLFIKRFLFTHFHTLTGIEVESRFGESLDVKARKILHFFESQLTRWKKEVRKVIRDYHDREFEGSDVHRGLAAILVLMAFFQEKEDALFLLADVTTTQADAEAQLSLPDTPRIIMLGDSILESKKWMLSIEGKVLIQPTDHQTDFTSALAVLFTAYYVFNIEYQVEAATTMEFIQR
ncbi:hypothetical protein UPYG_G00076820 [Umbra pygmaea]|uniref:Uncharacterized protein n=1 Tax=Umbra pygmaea TaxID=75934 RepID=A0ABD0Y0B3_UMBPY